MVRISVNHLQKMYIFYRFGVCGSKPGPVKPISMSNYQWAWQAFRKGQTLQIFKNYAFFIDEEMIKVSIYDISSQKFKI